LNPAVITDFPRCKQRCRNVARVRHRAYMKQLRRPRASSSIHSAGP
jgi:hypothetical protein